MADFPAIEFSRQPHPSPMNLADRNLALANPGFGNFFSDHMVSIDWTEGLGWHNADIGPRQPISLDPAAAVLHYAQEIFEGLKAYRLADGSIAMFRPDRNAHRFNASAERLAMPQLPEETFIGAIRELVMADSDWFPERRRRIALPATVHVRVRAVPGRAAGQGIQVPRHRIASGQLLQVGRSGRLDLGVERLYACGTRRHRCCQMRRELRRQPRPASRSNCPWARSGRVPRCGRTQVDRRTGRNEHVLRVRRWLDHHTAAGRHDPAWHHA